MSTSLSTTLSTHSTTLTTYTERQETNHNKALKVLSALDPILKIGTMLNMIIVDYALPSVVQEAQYRLERPWVYDASFGKLISMRAVRELSACALREIALISIRENSDFQDSVFFPSELNLEEDKQ
jgi:hypothetical protein